MEEKAQKELEDEKMKKKKIVSIVLETQLWIQSLPEIFHFFTKTLLATEKPTYAKGPREFCNLFDDFKNHKIESYEKVAFDKLATQKYLFTPEEVEKMINLHQKMIFIMTDIVRSNTFF